MTYFPIQSPYPVFNDDDGTPLENGYIYIGVANLNPITNAIAVSWDTGGLYPAAQPIRTIGGYPSRNGSPGILYVNVGAFSDYSILIQDKHGDQISFVRSAFAASGVLAGNNVDIVDDLRAITGYGQPVYVRGHSDIGDSGFGPFEYLDGAAPGTYVDGDPDTYVPTGGDGSAAWKRQYAHLISVKWFHAVGDGITDDTAALQAAIDHSIANASQIFLPRGTYLISSALVITNGFGGFRGEDVEGTIIQQSDTTENAFTFDGSGGRVDHTCLRNMTINGPGSGTGVGVYMDTCARMPILEDLIVTNWGSHGVEVINVQYLVMDRCRIRDNGGDGFRAHSICHHDTVRNCHISDNSGRGIYFFNNCFGPRIITTDVSNNDLDGIEIGDGGATTDVYNAVIIGGFHETNVDDAQYGAIKFNRAQGGLVLGTYMQVLSSAASCGIISKTSSAGIVIEACYFRAYGNDAGNAGAAIYLDNANEAATIIAPKFLLTFAGRDIVSTDAEDLNRYSLINSAYGNHYIQIESFAGTNVEASNFTGIETAPVTITTLRNTGASAVGIEIFSRNAADSSSISRFFITSLVDSALARFRNCQYVSIGNADVHDAPGLIGLRSTNGAAVTSTYYIWADSNGSLRINNAIPGNQDTNGTQIWDSGDNASVGAGSGVSGTFTTADAKTVTYTNGIITNVV